MLIDELMEEIYENSVFLEPQILNGSTPVVSFGDFTKSTIATLGINPSPLEFINTHGNLLKADKKRLTDLEILGLSLEDFQLSRTKSKEIWRGCQEYFNENRNPYWRWFGPLEEILGQSGFSYKSGTACHLDLSPIATKQIYSKLSDSEKYILIMRFRSTLKKQLLSSNIKTIIFNGLTVFQTIQFAQNVHWYRMEPIAYKCNGRDLTARLHTGESENGQIYLGWTVNLQAFRGTRTERRELMKELSDWIQRASE